jgi:hypothetical protein
LTVHTLDKKITRLLTGLSVQQKETVLSVVENFVATQQQQAWKDDNYEQVMENRFADYENGTVKGFTIEESIAIAQKSFKAKQ